MAKIIQLFTDGKVEFKEREFTRLMGGFDNESEVMTAKQVSELMGYEVKVVNQTINRNKEEFTNEDGFLMDLKEVTQSDHNRNLLLEMGFTNMAISKAKNIYILSKAGFLLYLKFAEGDKAVELYKDFLEDYFRTKAENKVMKKTIEDEIKYWEEQKKLAIGEAVMGTDETIRIKALQASEEANRKIAELRKSQTEEHLMEQLKPQLDVADLLTNAKFNYDINTLSKALGIQGLGRNNLFKWLREKEILRKSNEPYQQYMKYFKVIYTTSDYGYQSSKTLIRPVGVEYLIKRLKKDGKVITKSVKDILSELEGEVA